MREWNLSSRRIRAGRVRLSVETLEGRIVPATRFVVPVGFEDGVSKFATLSAALGTSGLVQNDIIQIEPGSSPGTVTSNPTTERLTIQGNPAVGLASTPAFAIGGDFNVPSTQRLVLENLRIDIVGTGGFSSDGVAVIHGSQFNVAGSLPTPVEISGTLNEIIGNTFIAANSAITSLLLINPAESTFNLIKGNTFQVTSISNAGSGGDVITYARTASGTSNDEISGNIIIGGPTAGHYTGIHVNAAAGIGQGGFYVHDNIIDLSSSSGVSHGIWIQSQVLGYFLAGNRITVGGLLSAGILANGGLTDTLQYIQGNQLSAPGGAGLSLLTGSSASDPLKVRVQGNDFHGSQIGVSIDGAGGGPIDGIVLGGDEIILDVTSVGGNNFRGFTAAATPVSGAIVVTGVTTGRILAQLNLFAPGVTPSSVVSVIPPATIDVSNPQTGNTAYVSALYGPFLHRAADVSNAIGAGAWVSQLNNGGPRGNVATGIARSAESDGLLLDQMYVQLLNRPADEVGRSTFVASLQAGATLEDVMVAIVTSAEYAARQGSGGAFIQSLYLKFLDRTGSSQEISDWLNVLATQGAAAVVRSFAFSTEFRTNAVNQLYGFDTSPPVVLASILPPLLHRTSAPPPSQVAGWVNSGLDIFSIAVQFASSDEFFAIG